MNKYIETVTRLMPVGTRVVNSEFMMISGRSQGQLHLFTTPDGNVRLIMMDDDKAMVDITSTIPPAQPEKEYRIGVSYWQKGQEHFQAIAGPMTLEQLALILKYGGVDPGPFSHRNVYNTGPIDVSNVDAVQFAFEEVDDDDAHEFRVE